MNEPQQSGESGWTAAKVLGVIFGLLLMVGFGVCGLCGLAITFSQPSFDRDILMLALAGLAIAIGGLLLVRKMVRLARRDSGRTPL